MKFSAIFLVLMTWMYGVTCQAQAPSAFEFMKPAENIDLVLSPSGKYVAFTETVTDKFCIDSSGQMKPKGSECKKKYQDYGTTYVVRVFDLKSGEFTRTAPVPANFYVGWLAFASDDRLLMSIGVRRTVGRTGRRYTTGGSRVLSFGVELPTDGAYDAVALFNDQRNVLRGNRNLTQVSNFLKDDPNHIIMPARKDGDLDLWKVNVYNGEAERVAVGKSGTVFWYTNKAGEPVLRYDCTTYCRKIKIFAPGDEPGSWEKIREFKIKPDDGLEDSQFYPIALTKNENQIYVIADEDSDPRRSIKVFDLKTKNYVRTVYQHPEMDVGGALLNIETDDYMGAWVYEDRLKYFLEDPTLQKHYDALDKYFKYEANIRLIGYDSQGTKAVVYVSSHNKPGAYYIYNFAAKSLEELVSSEPTLEDKLNSSGRIMQIPLRDGATISAYHYYPTGRQSGAPLLVMPHGGPHVRDTFTFDYWAQYFVARGYQVVQMNFRGSDGYGRDFERAGYGEWGGLMYEDITDTVKYFHAQNLSSPEKTCIVGYSFGGYAALLAGAKNPELYSCIVSGGGPSDLIRMMKDDKGNLNEETYEFLKESVGDPKTEKDKLAAISPVNMASQFQDPVLLIHGEYDGRVDISHAEKMRRALDKADKSVVFQELEGVGHSRWDLTNEILYLETIDNFLRQHLLNNTSE